MKNKAFFFLLMLLVPVCFSSFSKGTQQQLKVDHLSGDFYVYTTYGFLNNGSRYPSNSMYVVTKEGVVMLDVPWDTTQIEPLLDTIEQRHHQKVIACISTHFHDDRTAGLGVLQSKGIKTYGTAKTIALCKKEHNAQPDFVIPADTVFDFGNHKMRVYYPGAGHTVDNMVVWFPRERILYGGCLIKSIETTDLGNIADADIKEWPHSIRKIQRAFPYPEFVIPGHGSFKSTRALERTLQLLSAYSGTHK